MLARMFAEDGRSGPLNFYGDIDEFSRGLAAEGDGRAVRHACTESCITPCTAYIQDMPGVTYDRKWSGGWVCVGRGFLGPGEDVPAPMRPIFVTSAAAKHHRTQARGCRRRALRAHLGRPGSGWREPRAPFLFPGALCRSSLHLDRSAANVADPLVGGLSVDGGRHQETVRAKTNCA